MGNTLSVEAPTKGSKVHKLSKPRTSNPVTAGLLNDSRNLSDNFDPYPCTRGRRLSFPHSSTSARSPRYPVTGTSTVEDLVSSNGDVVTDDLLSSSLDQPCHPLGILHRRSQRSQSVGVVPSSKRSRGISRPNSIYTSADEIYENTHPAHIAHVTHLKKGLAN